METEAGHRIVGQATNAEGKKSRITVTHGTYKGGNKSIRVEGREELTCAERARDEFFLRLLQGSVSLGGRRFIDLVWFPSQTQTLQKRVAHSTSIVTFPGLNDSQRQVATAMISTTDDIVIAHGEFHRPSESCRVAHVSS